MNTRRADGVWCAMKRSQATIGLLAALMILTACASAQTSSPSAGEPDPAPTEDLGPEITAAIERRLEFGLRADPAYVAAVHAAADSIAHDIGILVTPDEAAELARRTRGQDDLGALATYGAEHPDSFGGMYIDQAGGGDVILLFTSQIELHARAVGALAPPGATVRVERVRFTQAELGSVMDNLPFGALAAAGHEMVSAHVDTIRNIVQLDLKSDDSTIEERLEQEHGGRLDVVVFPKPGPWENTASGDGWRLLATGLSRADAYTVRAATNADEWTAMWDAMGLDGAPPEVNFGDEVAVSFGHGVGSSCPERKLEAVVIDDELVYSETSDPLGPRACTTDLAGGAVFVVALSRSALPNDAFTLRLSEVPMPCQEECGITDEIEVDL